jgi:Na+/proline symporter
MFGGVVSGALIGLFFHREDWMGGYGSHRRRLVRLGHISFFGLGFLNVLFAFSHQAVGLEAAWAGLAGRALLVGAVTMPLCCFLSAWRKPLRHLFPVPVVAVLTGIVCTLLAWPRATTGG